MRKVEVEVGGSKTMVDVPDGSDINVRVIDDDEGKTESSPTEKQVLKGDSQPEGNVLKG